MVKDRPAVIQNIPAENANNDVTNRRFPHSVFVAYERRIRFMIANIRKLESLRQVLRLTYGLVERRCLIMKALTIALLLFVSGVFQLVEAQTYGHGPEKPATLSSNITASETLRRDMRKLWSDHVFWTRDYVVAAVADQPDAAAAAARLLKNQEDIGNAVATYYGKAAGDKLTAFLKEHILIAVDLVKAAKVHDQAKFQEADQKWDRNAEDIAEFLSKANPNWPKATLLEMMKMHLMTTKTEVTARLNHNWDEDVKAFDAVYDHILKMSDTLSDGIIKQFPKKF